MLKEPEFLLLRAMAQDGASSQRELAEATGSSLGSVNSYLRALREGGLVQDYAPTAEGLAALEPYRVHNAVLLAAGFGSRFVPFTLETPKGLLKVNGTPMIERQIEQLHERGITQITLVVGYLKESFDYLIDKYGVQLVYNPEYALKNNFASLYRVADQLSNTYVLVADDWIEHNIFNTWEYHSWLSCIHFDGETDEWVATRGPHGRITRIDIGGRGDCWALVGPAYFDAAFSARYAGLLREAYGNPGSTDFYWEQIVRDNLGTLDIYVNEQSASNVREFESLADLREYDPRYLERTENAIMGVICDVFGVCEHQIVGIKPIKEGITNESFRFTIEGRGEFVFRVPGRGTDKLINRASEKQTYEAIAHLDISDEIVFFDDASGNRITRFYDDVRLCDADVDADLDIAMQQVRRIHDEAIQVEHRFDVGWMIDYYQELADGLDAIRFTDFREVRAQADAVLALRERLAVPEVLCHGDYLYSNVLIFSDGTSRIIDFEYSGMADPIMDVAMFGIFSYFSRERLELSLRMYLRREPDREELVRLYLYTALGGLLWSIWAEYLQALGTELDDYPMIMYRYFKDYHALLKEMGQL